MKITVIVPVYNTADTLARCVDSIIAQSYSDWEVILIDDGSPDGAPAMCDDYQAADPRIRVLHKPNGGLSDARNAGIDMARGEWITFVDSDDYLSSDTLQTISDTADDNDETELIEYPATLRWGHNTCQQELGMTRTTYHDSSTYWFETQAYTHTYACNKAFRRELLKDIQFPCGKKFEDSWWLPQVLVQNPCITTTDRGHYYYTWNPQGITATASGEDMLSLLEAQINAAQVMHIDLKSAEASAWYMHLLNIQIHVSRQLRQRPILPPRHLPYSAAHTAAERIKVILLNTLGLNALCKIMRFIRPSR